MKNKSNSPVLKYDTESNFNTHKLSPQYLLQQKIGSYVTLLHKEEVLKNQTQILELMKSYPEKLENLSTDPILIEAYYSSTDLDVALYQSSSIAIATAIEVIEKYNDTLADTGGVLYHWNNSHLSSLKKLQNLKNLERFAKEYADKYQESKTELETLLQTPHLSVKSRIDDIRVLLCCGSGKGSLPQEEKEDFYLQYAEYFQENEKHTTELDDLLYEMRPSGGICTALSILWAYGKRLADIRKDLIESNLVDNIDFMIRCDKILIEWDGKSLDSLGSNQKADIERFISNIMLYQQGIEKYLYDDYSDKNGQFALDDILEEVNLCKPSKEFDGNFCTNSEGLGRILNHILKPGALCFLIRNGLHATSVYKSINGTIEFFDPSVGEYEIGNLSNIGSDILDWGKLMAKNNITSEDYELTCNIEDMDEKYGLTLFTKEFRHFDVKVFSFSNQPIYTEEEKNTMTHPTTEELRALKLSFLRDPKSLEKLVSALEGKVEALKEYVDSETYKILSYVTSEDFQYEASFLGNYNDCSS